MKNVKRWLSGTLAAALMLSMAPLSVMAANGDEAQDEDTTPITQPLTDTAPTEDDTTPASDVTTPTSDDTAPAADADAPAEDADAPAEPAAPTADADAPAAEPAPSEETPAALPQKAIFDPNNFGADVTIEAGKTATLTDKINLAVYCLKNEDFEGKTDIDDSQNDHNDATADFSTAIDATTKKPTGRTSTGGKGRFVTGNIRFPDVADAGSYIVREVNFSPLHAYGPNFNEGFDKGTGIRDMKYTTAGKALKNYGITFPIADKTTGTEGNYDTITFSVQALGASGAWDENAETVTFTIQNGLVFQDAAEVVLAPDANLTGVKAEQDAPMGEAKTATVTVSGSVVSGLDQLKTTVPDAYKQFDTVNAQGTSDGSWAKIIAGFKGTVPDYTIVTLRLPVPASDNVQIKQSSKALMQFYCQGKSADAKSDYNGEIVVDKGATTATRTKTYNSSAITKADDDSYYIDLCILMMKDDTVTLTIGSDPNAYTYTIKNTLEYTQGDKPAGEVVIDTTPANSSGAVTASVSSVTDSTVENKTVVINAEAAVSAENAKSATITVDNSSAKAIAKAESVTVETNLGSITVPKEALGKINTSGSDGLTIEIKNTTGSGSGGGSAPVAEKSFELVLKQGSTELVDATKPLTTGKLTVSLFAGKGFGSVKVYYVPGGSAANVPMSGATYDPATGFVTYETSHLSNWKTVAAAKINVTDAAGGLGSNKTLKVTNITALTAPYMTVAITNASGGQTLVVVPATEVANGSNKDYTAIVSIPSGATITGAWLTDGIPTLTAGDPTGKSIVAEL